MRRLLTEGAYALAIRCDVFHLAGSSDSSCYCGARLGPEYEWHLSRLRCPVPPFFGVIVVERNDRLPAARFCSASQGRPGCRSATAKAAYTTCSGNLFQVRTTPRRPLCAFAFTTRGPEATHICIPSRRFYTTGTVNHPSGSRARGFDSVAGRQQVHP